MMIGPDTLPPPPKREYAFGLINNHYHFPPKKGKPNYHTIAEIEYELDLDTDLAKAYYNFLEY